VSWKAVPGAVAYNVRWGIQKDKLYQTYQVFCGSAHDVRSSCAYVGENYFFAVEAFNENGVSKVSEVIATP